MPTGACSVSVCLNGLDDLFPFVIKHEGGVTIRDVSQSSDIRWTSAVIALAIFTPAAILFTRFWPDAARLIVKLALFGGFLMLVAGLGAAAVMWIRG